MDCSGLLNWKQLEQTVHPFFKVSALPLLRQTHLIGLAPSPDTRDLGLSVPAAQDQVIGDIFRPERTLLIGIRDIDVVADDRIVLFSLLDKAQQAIQSSRVLRALQLGIYLKELRIAVIVTIVLPPDKVEHLGIPRR